MLCEADKSHVAMVVAGKYYGTPVISYSFNPNKLTNSGLNELQSLLELTLDHGYQDLYANGSVSYCEFYIDVENIDYGSLAILDRGKRRVSPFKGTKYCGPRQSVLVGTMYNRAKKLMLDSEVTRFEFRVRRRETTLRQLVELSTPNPLLPFLVVPTTAIASICKKWKYSPDLASAIERNGLHGGIKNSTARKLITKELEACAVP